jgi:hypothetical protein
MFVELGHLLFILSHFEVLAIQFKDSAIVKRIKQVSENCHEDLNLQLCLECELSFVVLLVEFDSL